MIGPCAKRRVVATLVLPDGRTFTAENLCANAQATCPRLPGEGYEKCDSVCQLMGHAEMRALDTADDFEDVDTQGARMYVGHHYACSTCETILRNAGIDVICTAPVDSERTPNQ